MVCGVCSLPGGKQGRNHYVLTTARINQVPFVWSQSSLLPLEPLNVFIGPNGSGKSNLIEAVRLLQAAPDDLAEPVRLGGGVQDWIWKGDAQGTATIDVIAENPNGQMPLRHLLQFRESGHRFELADERIENERAYPILKRPIPISTTVIKTAIPY